MARFQVNDDLVTQNPKISPTHRISMLLYYPSRFDSMTRMISRQ